MIYGVRAQNTLTPYGFAAFLLGWRSFLIKSVEPFPAAFDINGRGKDFCRYCPPAANAVLYRKSYYEEIFGGKLQG